MSERKPSLRKRYEYKQIAPPSFLAFNMEGWLNEMGADGWILVHVSEGVFTFVRGVIHE